MKQDLAFIESERTHDACYNRYSMVDVCMFIKYNQHLLSTITLLILQNALPVNIYSDESLQNANFFCRYILKNLYKAEQSSQMKMGLFYCILWGKSNSGVNDCLNLEYFLNFITHVTIHLHTLSIVLLCRKFFNNCRHLPRVRLRTLNFGSTIRKHLLPLRLKLQKFLACFLMRTKLKISGRLDPVRKYI